jgi:hypothetical protein
MNKIKELAKNKIVLIAVAVISFLVVREIKIYYQEKQAIQKGLDDVGKRYDDVLSKTKEGESAIENVKKEFSEIAKQKLDSKKDEKSKIYTAANYIWGSYMLNVRTRYDFCKAYGVDIGEFVQTYKNKNSYIMNDVSKIFKIEFTAKNLEFNENRLYSEVKEFHAKVVKQDMLEVAKTWDTNDMKLVCQNFNEQANMIADILSLDKTMPEIAKIVIDGSKKLN